MKKSLVCAGSIAAAFATIFAASAQANPYDAYAGQTYAKVQERTQGKAVIASRTGSYLPTDECIVTGSRRTTFADSSGNGGAKLLVDLNCNDTSALNGHPGNSVATEAGQKALKLRETAKSLSKDYDKATAAGKTPACFTSAGSTGWCVRTCEQSKACSDELMEALGM